MSFRQGSRHLTPKQPPRDGSEVEAAAYLAGALGELINLAQRHRLDMLCYLLDMARLEAAEVVRSRRRGNSTAG